MQSAPAPKYIVAEEDSENAGSVVIISEKWLTPKKFEAFWPTCKLSNQFNKLLQKHQEPKDDWQLINIKRKFFETDDLIIARKKAKQAELHSDFTDADEDIVVPEKRKRKPRFQSDTSDEETETFNATNIFKRKGTVTPMKTQDFDSQLITPDQEVFESLPDTTPSSQRKLDKELDTPWCPRQTLQVETLPVPVTPAGFTSGYQSKTLQLLTTIVEQNNQILHWIRGQNDLEALNSKKSPIELPVQLPLNELEELSVIEKYLTCDNNFADFCNYLIAFCGNSTTTSINILLKHCMTNELASKFNFRGKKNKRAFEELYLKTAIIRAVKKQFKLVIEKDLENDIKVWLKHAPQRAKARLAKNVTLTN